MQLNMSKIVASIACVVASVTLIWYCCGDQIAFVYQVQVAQFRTSGDSILGDDNDYNKYVYCNDEANESKIIEQAGNKNYSPSPAAIYWGVGSRPCRLRTKSDIWLQYDVIISK